MYKAKIFKNGNSQAVRLPKEFRVSTREVSVIWLGKAIVLQPINKKWLEIYNEIIAIPDFMDDYQDLPAEERESL